MENSKGFNKGGTEMTDTITLRRAAEQARSAIRGFYNKYSDEAVHEDAGRAIAALNAALAEPVHPGYIIGSHWLETAYSRIAAGEAEADVLAEVLGARGWAKRKPATKKEIDAEWLKIKPVLYPMDGLSDFRDGFRAAERFHGIRKEDKP
jgi:hypothetical protein